MRHILLLLALPLLLSFSLFASSFSSIPLEDTTDRNNINGYMPENIYVSTLTQAFCKGFSFSIYNGKIWVKKDGDKEWSLFLKTGLPQSAGKKKLSGAAWFAPPKCVTEIAADGDALFAFDDEGHMYRCYLQDTTIDAPFTWLNTFGWPKKQVMNQTALVMGKRGWGMGVRRKDVLWYEDRFGNQHHYGTMGLETVYFLTADGREIRFTDSGLPADVSHTILGPERGSFTAENISVSADTLFLISKTGEMYTRLIDFDTMGCDPMFFKYTYKQESQKLSGKDYLSNYSPWGLPNEDWYKQPPIPLTGKARLTKHICIFQNGQGNFARGLRVAGLSAEGYPGFYYKGLTDTAWQFFEAPLKLDSSSFLTATPEENCYGPKNEYAFKGYITRNNVRLADITCSIPDFSLTSEGSCTLTVECGGEKKTCTLYSLEIWTYVVRYNPGFDGTPRNYFVTPSFSSDMLVSKNQEFSTVLNDIFEGRNLDLYAFTTEATDRYVEIGCSRPGKADYTLFLTKEPTDMSPEAFKSTILYNQPLLQDSTDASLILDPNKVYTVFDAPEIDAKINNNKKYIEQLNSELETYEDYHRGTTVSRWGFKTVDLLTSITLLNKIDFPKIKTITMFTGEIMDTNARNFRTMAEYRSLTYPYLITLIEQRIACYEKVFNTLPCKNDIKIDSRLRSTYPEYFKEAGISPLYRSSRASKSGDELSMLTQVPIYPGFQLKLVTDENAEQIIMVEVPDIITDVFKNKSDTAITMKVHFYPMNSSLISLVSGFLEWDGSHIKIWDKDKNSRHLLFEGVPAEKIHDENN